MFCTNKSLPKKADVRNISQTWVKISRWIERAGERRSYVSLTKAAVCIQQHLSRMRQMRYVRLNSWCYSKAPGQNTLGCFGINFSPYCFINVSQRPSFASVYKKKKKKANFKSSILHQNKFDTSNQASSATPMHNRSLIQIFPNIQHKSLPKHLFQSPISIFHISDYLFLFLCIFHVQNRLNLLMASISSMRKKANDIAKPNLTQKVSNIHCNIVRNRQ